MQTRGRKCALLWRESDSVASVICEDAHLCKANVQAANDALKDVEGLTLDGHSVRDVCSTRCGVKLPRIGMRPAVAVDKIHGLSAVESSTSLLLHECACACCTQKLSPFSRNKVYNLLSLQMSNCTQMPGCQSARYVDMT